MTNSEEDLINEANRTFVEFAKAKKLQEFDEESDDD